MNTRRFSRRTNIVIGLVGGIGSGKSMVADLFRARGAYVIDADALCRRLLTESPMKRAIARRWGKDMIGSDGEIARVKLAAAVFGSASAVEQLNRIMHPRVRRMMNRAMKTAARHHDLIVVDAPLLVESGYDRHCDRLVYVHAPEAARLRRVRETRGWSAAELRRRTRRQQPLNLKRQKADDVVNNSGTRSSTRRQVNELVDKLTQESARERHSKRGFPS